MTVQAEQVAHAELVGGGVTDKHSHGGAFPVGSVFLSVVATNPATLLGYGTWSQIAQGQFLVGQKSTDTDFDVAEETGGAKAINLAHAHNSHTLTSSKNASTGSATDKVTAPTTHATDLSATQSILNPYFVVYIWKRLD